jgi:GAF domain-containing protein
VDQYLWVSKPEVSARLLDAAATLEALGDVLDEEEQLDLVLARLTETAVRTVPHASAVSVTVLANEPGQTAWTAAATHDIATKIDTEQYNSGKGPCLEAARQRHLVRVDVTEARDRWPTFADSAAQAGMLSYLSAPLVLDGENSVLGALNVYGRTPNAFDSLDEALVTLFTTATSAAIVNARRYMRARELASRMRAALTSRAEIDQAKGMIMAQRGVSAQEAFQLMVEHSQQTNTKLRDVAHELLKSAGNSHKHV